MPYLDTTSIGGGNGQTIADWNCGDDRIFTGTISGLWPSDPSATDAYFTLKRNPNDPDADAVLQKHVVQGVLDVTGPGQITIDGSGNYTELLIHVYSADYEGLVYPGTSYWWDFRIVTTYGSTITIATGLVAFLQQVTQTNVAGTPAALPNNALPRVRGFLPTHPKNITGFAGVFNIGDLYFNSQPEPGGPSGWVCIAACTDSSGFVTNGIVGND
jgi:hypothetical protein